MLSSELIINEATQHKNSMRKGFFDMTCFHKVGGVFLLPIAACLSTQLFAAPPATSSNTATPATKSNATSVNPAQQQYGKAVNPSIGANQATVLNGPLTLNEAISIALAQQDSIAIAKAQQNASHDSVTAARSNFYPQIAPSFQYSNTISPIPPSVGSGTGSSHGEGINDGILLKQTIWDTGKREATLQEARNNLFASEYNLGNTRQSVIRSVTQSFYTLLLDQALIRVQQTSVDLAKETYQSIQAQVNAQVAAKVNLLQAQSDLANAQVALLQAQNQAGVDEATLENAIGIVTNTPLVLATTDTPQISIAPDTKSVQSYVKEAYAQRLDIKEQQAAVDAQTDSLRLARINAGISVNATISEGYQLDPASGEQRAFLVNFSYPLFDGGFARSQVKLNEAQLVEQERSLDALEQTVRLNVHQDYLTRELSRQQIVASNTAVAAGKANYAAALGEQQAGIIDILAVINARLQLITAEVNQVNATYNYYIANARLLRDIGANDPAFATQMPLLKDHSLTQTISKTP